MMLALLEPRIIDRDAEGDQRAERVVVQILKKHLRKKDGAPPVEAAHFELAASDARDLGSAFAAPRWLRDLGRTSWLLVGVFALLAGAAWLLGTTSTIVGPVVAGTIVAAGAVAGGGTPGRHLPPPAGAAPGPPP